MSETKVKNREAILDLAKIYVEKQNQIQEIEQELKTIKDDFWDYLKKIRSRVSIPKKHPLPFNTHTHLTMDY